MLCCYSNRKVTIQELVPRLWGYCCVRLDQVVFWEKCGRVWTKKAVEILIGLMGLNRSLVDSTLRNSDFRDSSRNFRAISSSSEGNGHPGYNLATFYFCAENCIRLNFTVD